MNKLELLSKLGDEVSYDFLYKEARMKTIKNFIKYMQQSGKWLRKSQLTSMDMIDIWQSIIVDADRNDEDWSDGAGPRIAMKQEDLDFAAESFYNILPPLNSGVIKVNKQRWYKFNVENVDEEDKSYFVMIEDYAFEEGMFVCERSVVGIISYRLKEDGSCFEPIVRGIGGNIRTAMEMAIEDHEYLSNPDDDTERKVFINYIDELKSIEEEVHEDLEKEAAILVYKFLSCIVKTNRQLYLSKPKAVRSRPVNHVRYVEGEVDPKHKQIVRAIGDSGIFITSVKPPKLMNEEIIRHYHVACWNSRGHVRHYKSGKTVYVRPTVKHRKCMSNKEQILPQTIIKVGKGVAN